MFAQQTSDNVAPVSAASRLPPGLDLVPDPADEALFAHPVKWALGKDGKVAEAYANGINTGSKDGQRALERVMRFGHIIKHQKKVQAARDRARSRGGDVLSPVNYEISDAYKSSGGKVELSSTDLGSVHPDKTAHAMASSCDNLTPPPNPPPASASASASASAASDTDDSSDHASTMNMRTVSLAPSTLFAVFPGARVRVWWMDMPPTEYSTKVRDACRRAYTMTPRGTINKAPLGAQCTNHAWTTVEIYRQNPLMISILGGPRVCCALYKDVMDILEEHTHYKRNYITRKITEAVSNYSSVHFPHAPKPTREDMFPDAYTRPTALSSGAMNTTHRNVFPVYLFPFLLPFFIEQGGKQEREDEDADTVTVADDDGDRDVSHLTSADSEPDGDRRTDKNPIQFRERIDTLAFGIMQENSTVSGNERNARDMVHAQLIANLSMAWQTTLNGVITDLHKTRDELKSTAKELGIRRRCDSRKRKTIERLQQEIEDLRQKNEKLKTKKKRRRSE